MESSIMTDSLAVAVAEEEGERLVTMTSLDMRCADYYQVAVFSGEGEEENRESVRRSSSVCGIAALQQQRDGGELV